jgi:cytochrome c oxidase subunit 2
VGNRRAQWVLGTILIASAIGIAIGLAIDWFPPQGSEQAKDVDTLYDVLIIASVPMFVLVTAIIVFSVIFFRMRARPGERGRPADPRQHPPRGHLDGDPGHPDRRPVHLRLHPPQVDIEEKPAQASTKEIRLRVDGEQFAWTFTYPGTSPAASR